MEYLRLNNTQLFSPRGGPPRRRAIRVLVPVALGALVVAVLLSRFFCSPAQDPDGLNVPPGEEPGVLLGFDLPLLDGPPTTAGAEQIIIDRLGRDMAFGVALGQVADSNKINRGQAFASISALESIFDFRRMRPEHPFTLVIDRERNLESVTISTSPIDRYVATRGADNRFTAEKVEVETRTVTLATGGTIHSSLYGTVEQMGEHPALVAFFVDSFAWDIDFFTDTRAGDQFKVLVEKIYHEDQFVRYGEILAAEYRGRVGTFRSFRYVNSKDEVGHYNDKGESVRKNLLRTPLQYTRISSGFGLRRHPVLQRDHMHLGVDYAAPTGTPVRAVADGVVSFAAWRGANGNLVEIRHANGYESQYGHLSRFHPGIRRGVRVRQMQVIGYVGMTGRATGPHLHFGLKKNGKHINPLKVTATRDDGISRAEMARFKEATSPLVEAIDQFQAGDPALKVVGLEEGNVRLISQGPAVPMWTIPPVAEIGDEATEGGMDEETGRRED